MLETEQYVVVANYTSKKCSLVLHARWIRNIDL